MRVALYLRRSTNEELQADSLCVQEEILRRFAAAHDHLVTQVFRDSASGRSVKKRDEFKTMINTVISGKAPFEAVLVRDCTRWGRFENVDESAYWEFLLYQHGVNVLYVEETFRDDNTPYATLMKSLKRVLASEYSRERSQMIRYAQERVTRNGYRFGAEAPYGLCRVAVRPDGTTHVLRRGERKAVGNWRTKLAPGDPEAVTVVQRIFAMYVTDDQNTVQIADVLNREGVAPPQGKQWWPPTISGILRNPAYCGTASYHQWQGVKRTNQLRIIEQLPVVERQDSYEPLVSSTIWERARAKLRAQTHCKSDEELAQELRAAFERWGHVTAAMLPPDAPCWQTYANRFRNGYREALEHAYEETVTTARSRIRALLDAHFDVVDFEQGWLVNGLLYVGCKYSFPRARIGALHWEFRFDGDEHYDVTIGFGFSPPPEVRHAETFLLQNTRFRRQQQTVYPNLHGGKANQHHIRKDDAQLIAGITRAIYWRNTRAEKAFLAAVSGQAMVNVAGVGRLLGWPAAKAQIMYRKLRKRGVPLPPQRVKHGRRITVVCPRCTASRSLRPFEALQQKTHLCAPCNRFVKTKEKPTVTCPGCGATRRVYPSVFKKLSGGVATPCHACALQDGRAKQAAIKAAQRVRSERHRIAVLKLLPEIVREMRTQSRLFPNAQLWASRPYPELIWRRPKDRARCRLVVRCADEALRILEQRTPRARALAHLQQRALDRKRWIAVISPRSFAEAWIVTI